jgi:REP element-mobilizing transposase RayT
VHPLRSSAVVGWLDVFTRNEYKDLFLESVAFCQKNKGLEIHAWCIMSNHVHLVFRSVKDQKPELLIGDLKRFTSQSIVKSIQENPRDPSLKVRIGEAKQKRILVGFF